MSPPPKRAAYPCCCRHLRLPRRPTVPPSQTDWEGGYFPLTMQFTEDYPNSPPSCKFPSGFFHINVYDSGAVCLSILSSGWKPSITVKQILMGIQELFDDPNPMSAAQNLSYELYKKNMPEYRKCVRQQAKKYPSAL
ncbi:SUMO-conjugating enzyme SCE1-like isoform X3 [Oryza brachyantha]|uniref:SUMO-conjugating enzyme SCE1-like isoform X3 n=1 Tax=Oryza brachyantha TaxID=4533 RepID=UPI00077653D0|nr:SUMO-conjugating enzyme SCE1-like isoform X3 [Oryza brachyantha]